MHWRLQAYTNGCAGYEAEWLMDDTNRHDFKGCQEWRWTNLPFAKIYKGLLAYSLILSEMQRIAF